jgi:hypothetical protein
MSYSPPDHPDLVVKPAPPLTIKAIHGTIGTG